MRMLRIKGDSVGEVATSLGKFVFDDSKIAIVDKKTGEKLVKMFPKWVVLGEIGENLTNSEPEIEVKEVKEEEKNESKDIVEHKPLKIKIKKKKLF